MIPVRVDSPDPRFIRSVTIAENQEEYDDLPALVYPEGSVLTHWSLSPEEIEALKTGSSIQLWVWTFAGAFPPIALRVEGVKYEGDDL